MNKHQAHDLKQMQSLPLEAKIWMTQQRIRQWYDHWEGEVYVSFSGGKDSTVLKHIVDNTLGVYDVPAVFVNTGLEYPEIQKFVKDINAGKFLNHFNSNVEIIRPEMRFDEVIKKYGYPAIGKEVAQKVYETRKSAEFHGIDYRETTAYNREFNPESEHSKKHPNFCLKKWDYLFDSDFDISNMCCKVMKKILQKNTKRKADENLLLERWQQKADLDTQNGCSLVATHLKKEGRHPNPFHSGRNKIFFTTSKSSMFLIAQFTVIFM